MARIQFEEVQSFHQARWLLIRVIAISFAVVGPFLYGMYWQLVQGEPWGNSPMSDMSLAGTSLLVFVLMGLILWLIFNIRLHTRIDEQGLHFRFFPNQWKWQTVTAGEIENYELKTLGFFRRGGWGFHRNVFTKFKAMTISGNQVLELRLKNGHRLRIGTQDSASLERAMHKMMNPQHLD